MEAQKSLNVGCPRVSIITPFLDNEDFLRETIESVIAQTFSDWEYILVDDGSRAAASEIAMDYAARYPGKIRYLDHPGHLNRGISVTRNLGLARAQGMYIAFLDSDDIWLPTKLAEHVAVLDAREEVGLVCGTTVEWRSWSGGLDRIMPTGIRRDVVINPPEVATELYPLGEARAPSFSDVVFRAEVVRRLGGFADQFTGLYDDQVLLAKIYLSVPVYFCSALSNKYRQHDGSICATATRTGTGQDAELMFWQWLKDYLSAMDISEPRIEAILQNRLRRLCSPRLDTLAGKAAKRIEALSGRLKVRTRLRLVVRRIRSAKPKPTILLYHRIADVRSDPWSLSVSPAHFEEQLDVLRRTRQTLSLSEFVEGLSAGNLSGDAVAVTFDDGYADNLTLGKPRLATAGVPATVFVATGYVNAPREFWWDELMRLILLGDASQNAEIVICGQLIRLSLGTGSPAEAMTEEFQRKRRSTLMSVWQILRPLDEVEREAAMSTLRSNFTAPSEQLPSRAMSDGELRQISADGLVTIGAHTVTHPTLPALGSHQCRHEITESKRACEMWIGRAVTAFAYPYGDFDRKVRDEVVNAGFGIACSTQRGAATPESDHFALPRIYVPDVGGDAFEEMLLSASEVG